MTEVGPAPGTVPESRVEEIARGLAGLSGRSLHDRLREIVPELTLAERFELLHTLGVYEHPESLSGAASTLHETRRLRQELPGLLRRERVKTLVDVPCGDFHWMRELDLDLDYLGVDIVPALVERNRALYGNARRRFELLDATREPPPAADLIHCRDLFIHLSLGDIAKVLANFVASGSRLLLASHFGDRQENAEILSGDFRAMNLCRAPFHLPPPREVILEESELAGGEFPDRAMALWDLDVLRGRPPGASALPG